jgi:SAM-dependent methyltransferase
VGPFEYLSALIQRSSDDAPKKGPHITRFEMYRRLRNKLADHDADGKTGITISGSQNLAKTLGLFKADLKDLAHPKYDVTNLDFGPESLDFIVSDQVLEHVRGDIPKLFRDLAQMLKPGGFMVHATPFVTEIHPAPLDCWRFGPDGLKWLAEQADLEIIEVDGWGNRAVWLYIMLGHRMTPVPDDENHPTFKLATYNEKHYPIHVWIICRKPSGAAH